MASSLGSFAAILVLAPLLCMGQGFDPSNYGLPPFLTPSETFQDLCGSFTGSGPPLPTQLPQQFSVHVEANILNENRTVWVQEFYDDINNRGSITFVNEGVRERVIFDYNDNEIFLIPDVKAGTECSIHPLAESRSINFTFGITRVNGSIHIGSTSTFLGLLLDDIPTQYLGQDTVRGTPAEHWQACISRGNVSFFADYYYTTTDSWTYATLNNPEEFDLTLTQIVVQGNSLFNGTLSDFYHVYSAFGFQSGPESVPDRAFTVPTGLACAGRIPGIPVPRVPDYFSTYLQYVDTMADASNVTTVREFYDFQHQLFRFDVYSNGEMGGDPGPISIVHDFDSQLQYVINRHVSSCNVTTLSQAYTGDVIFDGDDNPRIASPGRFFFLNIGLNYSYEGVSTVRGVAVDSWVASVDSLQLNQYTNLTDGVYEVFFTRPEYTVTTDRSAGESVIPWRVNWRGLLLYSAPDYNMSGSMNVSYEMDFFDFSSSEPPYDAFDVSFCSDPDQSNTLALRFGVPREGIDFSTFRTNLRASIVAVTKLKPLQVNNIHIVSSNETHIFVVLHFTNLSDIANTDNIVTADEALETLQSAADPNSMLLPFQVDVSNGVLVSPVLVSTNRGRTISCNSTCECNSCPTGNPATKPATTSMPGNGDNITNRLGLRDGVVAGIAMGLFFGGFLFALLCVCICYTCIKCSGPCGKGKGSRDVSSIRYKKQDNELENVS